MVKIFLLFVEKLANSSLLPAFPATSRKILSHFSFAPAFVQRSHGVFFGKTFAHKKAASGGSGFYYSLSTSNLF